MRAKKEAGRLVKATFGDLSKKGCGGLGQQGE